MDTLTREKRMQIGCGYEVAVPGAKAWSPPINKLGYRHRPLPTICAGYTTRLPEVTEAIRAHAHWHKGQIAVFCGDDKPTDQLLAYVEILDAEIEAMKAWTMASVKDGGGRA